MKLVAVVLLFAASAFAQQPADPVATSCGPAHASLHVHLDKHPAAPAPPAPGQALVYFIQQSGTPIILTYPTTRIALDGAWAGAIHADSYFDASVLPGDHHVCAVLHSFAIGTVTELAHFHADPGTTYYYRIRFIASRGLEYLALQPVDRDEALHLIASDPLSITDPSSIPPPP